MGKITSLTKQFWLNKGYSEEEASKLRKEISKFNKEHWIKKGYTEEDAIKKVSEIQKENSFKSANRPNKQKIISCYKNEFWIKKGYTVEEAVEKIKIIKKEYSCWCKEHWIKKGYSEEDAIKKVNDIQKKNSKKSNNNDIRKKVLSPYTKEYWMKKGIIDENEIKIKIQEHKDKTNVYKNLSKEKYNSMMSNRKNTYDTKTDEQKKIINKSRGLTKDEYIKKYGKEEYNKLFERKRFPKEKYIKKYGEKKYIRKINKLKKVLQKRKFIKYSKISFELFKELEILINDVCLYGKKEKIINFYKNDEYFCYYVDFFYNNKIIEFYGDYYHGNPKMFKEGTIVASRYKKNKIENIWKYDEQRINNIKELGYDILIIWEQDYKRNKKEIKNKCLKWIKNL